VGGRHHGGDGTALDLAGGGGLVPSSCVAPPGLRLPAWAWRSRSGGGRRMVHWVSDPGGEMGFLAGGDMALPVAKPGGAAFGG
jgi:hypothetical protein